MSFAPEGLEARTVLTLPPTLTIPMIPDLDQFGDQILGVQSFGVPERAALAIFDTGASAVTFSPNDQALFAGIEAGAIPIAWPGGAIAGGIGGEITGDVSAAGTIYADGFHAFELYFDEQMFPVFSITLTEDAAVTPGIQAFVGTESGSPQLPTIIGTPVLHPHTGQPEGLAAHIKMRGASLDFSDLFPGLILPMPDVYFVDPGIDLTATAETFDVVELPMIPFGADNFDDPFHQITDTYLWLLPDVTATEDGSGTSDKSFLVDTGAQLSVISTEMAVSLGLDLSNPETTIDVQGVAGTESIPGYVISKLSVPRKDGGTLEFTDVPIYVLDIAEGIDGIFGMNLFNTANEILFDPHRDEGALLQVTYFSDPDRGGGDIEDWGDELNSLLGGSAGALLGQSQSGIRLPGVRIEPGGVSVGLGTGSSMVGFGSSVSFTATITPLVVGPLPTGTITFWNGTAMLGSTELVNGMATMAWDNWQVGTHVITAEYSGDPQYHGGTSSGSNVTVLGLGTTTTFGTPTTGYEYGEPVTLAVDVDTATGLVVGDGLVSFFHEGDLLGTAPVIGGIATYVAEGLSVGLNQFTATYSGGHNGGLMPSEATPFSVQIDPIATGTVLSGPAGALTFGQSVPLSVLVQALSTGLQMAGGVVEFRNGLQRLGSAEVIDGIASLLLADLSVGTHVITAQYLATDTATASTSAPLTLRVLQRATAVAVDGPDGPIAYGSPATITAAVTSGGSTVAGMVEFLVRGAVVGTRALVDGVATLAMSNLPVGTTEVSARFAGTSNLAGSVGSASVTVAPIVTTLTLGTGGGTPRVGQTVRLTATLDHSTTLNPTGSVTFRDGTRVLGTVAVVGGVATFDASLGVGAHNLTATYSGDQQFAQSGSASVGQDVTRGASTVGMSTRRAPRRMTLITARVNGAAGLPAPTGEVVFQLRRGGFRTVSLVNGVATLKIKATAGLLGITYNGDANFETSTWKPSRMSR